MKKTLNSFIPFLVKAEGFSRIWWSRAISILMVMFFIAVLGTLIIVTLGTVPDGLPGVIARSMADLCTAGSPDCSFEYLFSLVATVIFIASMITTSLVLIVHMGLHVKDLTQADLEVMDTLLAKDHDRLETIENRVRNM